MEQVIMNETSISQAEVRKKGISGSTIKIIAIVAMLIDHIGAVIIAGIIERSLVQQGIYSLNTSNLQELMQFTAENGAIMLINILMRLIGRIGFPIFCFLLVEGFLHTKNVTKYALRLLAFALISEIPFDLAFNGKPFYWGYQNVFFTLFIGLLVMIAYRAIEELHIKKFIKIILDILALAAGIVISMLLKTDYGTTYGIGVICIMALYIFRKNKVHQITAGCITFIWEITALFAFIPIGLYNGRRGLRMKYFFYAFYPLHLFILYLIARYMGLV